MAKHKEQCRLEPDSEASGRVRHQSQGRYARCERQPFPPRASLLGQAAEMERGSSNSGTCAPKLWGANRMSCSRHAPIIENLDLP